MIMESKTIADQAREYEAPSTSVFPVARVMTENRNERGNQSLQKVR